jgi:hypothetical protein
MRAYFAQLETSRQAKAAENLTTSPKTGTPGMGDSGAPNPPLGGTPRISLQTCRNLDRVCANLSGQDEAM